MERLLHYVWKHRLFAQSSLYTDDGKPVEIIDPGLHNNDAGPDFFNAKIRIDRQMWVGNVEIHLRSSDWFRHRHDTDAHYNNVVLHVVETMDCEVKTEMGNVIPQLRIQIPENVAENYRQLMKEDDFPPCHRIIPSIPPMHVHHWLSTLSLERLEAKTERIERWLRETNGDWERVFFITLARAFGFGKNTDAFELWAATIDPQHIGKHRDNPFQVEAFFLGQAGLLEDDSLKADQRDKHFLRLQSEYRFLQKKFQISPISSTNWKFLRLRPQNFPYRRLAQLSALYAARELDFSKVRETASHPEILRLLNADTLPYWHNRYTFGQKTKERDEPEDSNLEKRPKNTGKRPTDGALSESSIDLLIINAVSPMLLSYGKHHQDERLTERAFELLEAIRPEQNHIIRAWQKVGISAQHAADSQALIHLQQHYCDRRDCLRCRFGSRYLRHAPSKL
ncbi:DUF2851 family protein [Alloprevotella sp. OH1205_COT-284]|uniref:DUF2851 family protein n=1 Tax=Alloprevotella sp. OH1205_COT-284 TaxID=2491043 RepID=UPI000F601891|nr:DUF2851 family protein [Alloprevotella sp. OH1205_COT-284]RRD80858.1 DUF2851 family protein [Alloprevotella sp. OH1205_COT-284]